MMAIDDRIIAVYTKAAHLAQRLTGRTSYWFSQQCAVVISLRLMLLAFVPDPAFTLPPWVTFIAGIGFIHQAAECGRADRAFRVNPSSLPRIARTSVGASSAYFRVAFFTLCVGTAVSSVLVNQIDVVQYVVSIAMVSHYYLLAVVPMPPAAQRDRVRRPLIPQGAES